MKAMITKLYLARKQVCFFSGTQKMMCVNKVFWAKIHAKIPFCPAIDWTTVFSCIIQCCVLRQFRKGSADKNVVSGAFYIATQLSKYWRNKRCSNCLTKFNLCTNYDNFIAISFINFGIPYNLKSTLEQTGELSCVIEILFSLKYSRMVLMVVCCRYRIPFDVYGYVCTKMNVTFYVINDNIKWQTR